MNELLFVAHVSFISCCILAALWIGKEAVIVFISLLAVLSNIFVLKQITLFGFTATPADPYTVGTVLSLSLLQEFYGKPAARAALRVSFYALIFYGIVSQFQLWYVPTFFDSTQTHYLALLGFMPRIIAASLTAYFLVAQLDIYLFGLLKKLFHDRYLVARTFFTVAVCQFLDTILFTYLGLYGIVSNVWHIIMVSYAIKIATIAVATPFIALSKKLIKISA